MRILKFLDTILARIEGGLIVLLLSLMVFFTFLQVCLRSLYTHLHFQWANALMSHLDWSEPFVRLLVLWLTFLGASLVTRDDKHIRIDFFAAILPPKWLKVRALVLCLAGAAVTAVMVKVCVHYIRLEHEFGGVTFLGLPTWLSQIILPLGFATLFFRFALRALDQVVALIRGTAS
ncbi:TRAP transporter small permease [Thermodesulfobacteriota bacterium]